MSIVATSKTGGSATLENLTTGQKVTQKFSGETSGSLCQTSAEFIIEDFEECSGSSCEPVPFASFSPAVKFTDVSATANGASVPLSSAQISEVIVDNQDLTKSTISGTTLTITYQ
jgi:hypothetical protein